MLNYAEGDSGTLSGHGVALWRVQRMDVALVCAPRSALSGLMTALCNHTQALVHTLHIHTHTHIQYRFTEKEESLKDRARGRELFNTGTL